MTVEAPVAASGLDRRRFVQLAGLSGAALLAGCRSSSPLADRRPLRLGYVSPQSGALFAFGEADNFVISSAQRTFKDGLEIGGRAYPVEILVRDSQSDPERAGEVAADLIAGDQVDLMLVSSTPETTNPVADACERSGVPCISTVTPYQPWFLARDPPQDPRNPEPYHWTWHFFWGLEDIIGVFSDMWGQVENNQVLGGLWPDDGDGRAWSSGFPAALEPQGYRIVDPGRYQDEKDSFRFEVQRFKDAGADIVTGVPLPPDFATFWKQAGELGYRPRVATVGKALLFPAFIEAMGSAEGVSTEVWWSPSHPFRSSLTGASAGELAQEYTRATGRQWTQPIGFVHALFEVAADVLRRAGDVSDRQALVDAIKATSLNTIVGRVSWAKSQADFPNVARTPLVGGQWRRGRTWPFELEIVSNATHPEIPASGTLQPIA
ncbi:MAG TPA: ABC transporter substrate-binding protein [Actinomycetota bacterium]|nr:ABC transporter substrate-binding protein [Actinomycetota bacterium]